MLEKIMCINDVNFNSEVARLDKLVLVVFEAPWCGPCVRQLSILEQFVQNNNEQVVVFKIDIDESPLSTSKYEIRNVPTLILFKNGEPIHTKKVGFNSLSTLMIMLKSSI